VATTNYWVSILNAGGCESSRTQVTATFPSVSTDTQTPGAGSWIGYVYDGYDTNFANNIYYGHYTESETFDQGFGGDYNCFNITSNSTIRSIYTETFSVRYRMNSTKDGLYVVDLGSDDGNRLTVDGTLIVNDWTDHSFASRPRVLMNLNGASTLVYDFYENGGQNRVVFQNLIQVLANSLNTNATQSLCLGSSGTAISGDVFGTLPAGISLSGTGYQWTYSTTPAGIRTAISGATGATYTPDASIAPFNFPGTYYIYRNAVLSSTNNVSPNPYVATNESNAATITVNPLLPASVSIAAVPSGAICAGTSVTFTATPTNGGTTPTYQWYNGASPIAGATLSTYTSAALTNGNSITVQMTSNATCATGSPSTSSAIVMTVNPLLPASVSIVAVPSGAICTGTSVTFTSTPTNGGTTPAYQWKLNGTIVGTNSATYTNAALANGNTVTCVVTSNATCATGSPATSNTVTMTVNPNLPVSVSIAASANPVCSGTSVTFTATPTNGGTTPAYQWKVNGVNAGTNSATYSYSPANNDAITCVLTSNATCATGNPAISNTVTMTVNPNLPVSVSIAASANPVCSGTSVTFTATPTNGGTTPAYQWKVNGLNAGTNSATYFYSPANNDAITCVLTSNATCATGNPATSNTVTMTVTSGAWVGTTSSDWHTASNWCGGVPDATTNVTIPSGTPYQPVISAATVCNNITVNSGASLTITGSNTLTVSGNWTNNGTFTPNSSTVTFNSSGASTISPDTFYNITFNGSGTKTATGNLVANGNFTLNNGTFDASGYAITISGNYSQTAGIFDFNVGILRSSFMYLAGNLTNTAGSGSMTTSGAGAINGQIVFNGSAIQTVNFSNSNASIWIGYTVNSGSSVRLASNITLTGDSSGAQYYADFVVNGTIDFGTYTLNDIPYGGILASHFVLSSGANLITANSAGISLSGNTGSMQFLGSRTYNSNANYTYNGASAQVSGNGLTSTHNLTIANTGTAGNNSVTLSTAASVSGTLLLTSGLLATTSINLLSVTNTLTTAITGGSTTSFISGPVKWSLSTGTYLFPVGKSATSKYLPFTLAASSAASPVITLEAFDADAGAGATFDGTLSSVSHTEYWKADLNSGTFTGKVSLTRGAPLVTEDVIGKSTAQLGSYASIGGTASSPSINNSSDINSLGYFVMAAAANDCPVSTSVAPSADQTVCQSVAANQLTATITRSGVKGTPTLQ